MSNRFIQDPAAVLDYQFDWSAWLPEGDTISEANVTADEGLEVSQLSHAGGKVTAWVSGGVVGRTYLLTCSITTAGGRKDERTIRITIQDQ